MILKQGLAWDDTDMLPRDIVKVSSGGGPSDASLDVDSTRVVARDII